MLIVLATLSIASSPEADQLLARNAALYDEICLRAFPDDQAMEKAAKAHGAVPMAAEDVKVTLGDDPGRAWSLPDGNTTVWLELPPFHACSIRWNSTAMGDFSPYREIADRYETRTGGFSALDPYDDDVGDIHVHAIGEQKRLADNRRESLFIFDQQITNAARRAAGETGYVIRFVHQYANPPGN